VQAAAVKLATGLGWAASGLAVAYAVLFCLGAVGIALAGLWDPADHTWPLLAGAPATLVLAATVSRPGRVTTAKRWLGSLARSWTPALAMAAAVALSWIIADLR